MKKPLLSKKSKVHPDLGELKLEISQFGEITGNLDVDSINDFLNNNLEDKKLENNSEKD